jgi:hypothetical protein
MSGGDQAKDDLLPVTGGVEAAEQAPIEPSLRAYYAGKTAKAAAWVKAVRTAKLGAFQQADIDETVGTLTSLDPGLAKTRALADVPNPPVAIERWTGHAWRHLLSNRALGAAAEPVSPAIDQLAAIAGSLAPSLRAKSKSEKAFAENLLHISLQQLLDKRELDAGEVLRSLNGVFHKDAEAEERALRRSVGKRLRKAKLGQLMDLTLAFALSDAQGASLRKELADARGQITSLKAQLAVANDQVATAEAQTADRDHRIRELEQELDRVQKAVHDNQQLAAHGQSEIRGRLRAFLTGRLDQLLTDAFDAANDERPHLEVTRERIESAKAAIRGEINWLDTSSD